MFRLTRWVVRLTIAVLILALVAVGIDYGARIATEDQIASAVKHSSRASSVSVSISSFPYLLHLADQGRIDQVTVVAHQVPAGPLTLSSVQLVADGVLINRHDLLQGKEQLQRVSSATATIRFSLPAPVANLVADSGATVAPTSGGVEVVAGGRAVYTLRLSGIPLIPNCAFGGSQSGDQFTISCTVAPVPAAVLDSLSR